MLFARIVAPRFVAAAATVAVFCTLLVAASPAQAQTEAVVYDFMPGSGGINPMSRLTVDGKGNFYGTTAFGGLENGAGTVFQIAPNGDGTWHETVLYSFANGGDGGVPLGTVTFDDAGNLYGTTNSGGANGWGVVYELSSTGTGWTETVLHSFLGGTDGSFPEGDLIRDAAGNLYGTTSAGGSGGGGVAFELSPSRGGWTEQVIYAVDDPPFYGMSAALTMDAAGNIFGVSSSTAFKLTPNGTGGWKPTVIHTFVRGQKSHVLAGAPLLDRAGNLYGTMTAWHVSRFSHVFRGTVYMLSPGKNGLWKKKTLFTFLPDNSELQGNAPYGGLVLDAGGDLFGTTIQGGAHLGGTVFELIAPVGKGSYQEKVLWYFTSRGTDGDQPHGGVILDNDGNLFGTTEFGGDVNNGQDQGYGVVFKITP